jgi:hypothetical protein
MTTSLDSFSSPDRYDVTRVVSPFGSDCASTDRAYVLRWLVTGSFSDQSIHASMALPAVHESRTGEGIEISTAGTLMEIPIGVIALILIVGI